MTWGYPGVYVRSTAGRGDGAGDGRSRHRGVTSALPEIYMPPSVLMTHSVLSALHQQGCMQPNVPIPDLAAPAINASPTKVAPSAKFRVARKRARLFAIACDHPTQQGSPTVPFPDCAALARSLRYSTQTRPQPLRAHLRHLAPRGGMRAHLHRFTPPKSCASDTFLVSIDCFGRFGRFDPSGCLAHFEHFGHRADPLSETFTHHIRCTSPSGGVTTNIFHAHVRYTTTWKSSSSLMELINQLDQEPTTNDERVAIKERVASLKVILAKKKIIAFSNISQEHLNTLNIVSELSMLILKPDHEKKMITMRSLGEDKLWSSLMLHGHLEVLDALISPKAIKLNAVLCFVLILCQNETSVHVYIDAFHAMNDTRWKSLSHQHGHIIPPTMVQHPTSMALSGIIDSTIDYTIVIPFP
ncbi:hypothetical protein EDB85DRAFT_1900379 [Lactarius pseudohatsudake]|nr:hypothetical protein EDB85DRAFT_1900379 [Lactarius pseudohatsudake]